MSEDDSSDDADDKRPRFGDSSAYQSAVSLPNPDNNKSSVPSLASGFIRTDSSTKTAAVYNDVAKRLMVCWLMYSSVCQ